MGMLKLPVPVTGFAPNFSPMPRIAPPPFGRAIVGIGLAPPAGTDSFECESVVCISPGHSAPPLPRAQPVRAINRSISPPDNSPSESLTILVVNRCPVRQGSMSSLADAGGWRAGSKVWAKPALEVAGWLQAGH